MSANKVLILARPMRVRPDPCLERLKAAGFELVTPDIDRTLTEDELIAHLDGVFATIAGIEPYNDRVFAARPDLRLVARFGVGYDQVDLEAAKRHGVAVAMTFGTNHETVADYALALLLALGCHIVRHHTRVASGQWGGMLRPGVWGRTVGIVGLGRIGRVVAERCRGFKMEILGHDPLVDAATAEKLGIRLVELDELLAASDYVTLHAPAMPETHHMIDARTLGLMKPTAFLINTARGALIDEDALYDALTSGRLAGAGLDVFAAEPPVGSKLLALENVVLAPHAAGADIASEKLSSEACVDNVIAIAEGRDPGQGRLLNPEVLTRR